MKMRHLVLFGPIEDSLDEDLRRVLRPLGEAINDINRRVEEFTKKTDDKLDIQWFLEDQGTAIEDFLGLSFLALPSLYQTSHFGTNTFARP